MRISNYFGRYDETLHILSNSKINIDDIFYQNAILAESEIANKVTKIKCRPRCLWVALSSKCNINCIMCETHDKKWELESEEIQRIVDSFPYLEQLTWWGGEPTIHTNFLPLLRKALEYPHIKQTIITNGQYMPEELIEILKQTDKIDFVFSIDYVKKDKYESIRKGASFDKLIENLEKIKSIGVSARMNAVLMDVNSKDEDIDMFVEFGQRYNMTGIAFLSVGTKASNRASDNDIVNIQKRESNEACGEFVVKPAIMPEQNTSSTQTAHSENIDTNINSCVENHNTDNVSAYDHVENCEKDSCSNEVNTSVISENIDVSNNNSCVESCNIDNNSVHNAENCEQATPTVMCHTPWYQLTLDYNKVFCSDKNCLYYHKSYTTIENSNYFNAWNSEFMTSLREYLVKNITCHEKCSRYR